ncbi:MAG: hypothetical protein FWC50_00585, partial [Planctomycetaceae bacterium]|nr:hypothetical protein [Planctomycetaceae bacterium]
MSEKHPVGRKNDWKKWLAAFGSMGIALALMSFLLVVLAWATFVENSYNASVSQYAVYASCWFELLLALLGLNILCAMLARLPWRMRHLSFLTAHFGVILLLIGCFLTSRFGIQAQLSLFEGELGRFARLTSGSEISLEINDFQAENMEAEPFTVKKTSPVAESWTANEESMLKVKPRGTMLQQELDALRANKRIQVPVVTGPMSWREYLPKNWFAESRPFAWLIDWPLYLPMLLGKRTRGTVYDRDDIQVELLDYLADSTLKQVTPLAVRIRSEQPVSQESNSKVVENAEKQEGNTDKKHTDEKNTDDWKTLTLSLGNAFTGDMPAGGMAADAHPMMRSAALFSTQHATERVTFQLAETMAETEAFLKLPPAEVSGIWGNVILRAGGENHVFAVDDLIKLQTEFGQKIGETSLKLRSDEARLASLQLQLLDLLTTQKKRERENVDDDARVAGDQQKIDGAKSEIERLQNEMTALKKQLEEYDARVRLPVGKTGLTMEMVQFLPQQLAMMLRIRKKNSDTPFHIALFADAPQLSTHAKSLGTYAIFVLDPSKPMTDAPGYVPPMTLDKAAKPRLDLLQGADKKLYYRFWSGKQYTRFGDIGTLQNEVALQAADGSTFRFALERFEPQDFPGVTVEAVPFRKTSEQNAMQGGMMPQPRARVRATVDGATPETFWLSLSMPMTPADSLQETEVGFVSGKNRTVAVTFPVPHIDLGFVLYLKRFEQKLEPGTNMPSHYSSLVDLFPIDGKIADTSGPGALQRNVLIQMNRPGVFSDQVTGRRYRVFQSSFSGPYHPNSGEYQTLLGGYLFPNEETPRESLYRSILSVNHDPGRGLKYLGCLMIVLGTISLCFLKRSAPGERNNVTGQKPSPPDFPSSEHLMPELQMPKENLPSKDFQPLKKRNKDKKNRLKFGRLLKLPLLLIAAGLMLFAVRSANIVLLFPLLRAQESQTESEKHESPVPSTQPAPEMDKQESTPQKTSLDTILDATSDLHVSSTQLDWRPWRELPVFFDGRVMPLETYSRIMVENICGTDSPTLVLDENVLASALKQKKLTPENAARIRARFPKDGRRKFDAYQLIFAWQIEPELWEYIPFLPASNKKLRTSGYLKAGTQTISGVPLKYLSPFQVTEKAAELTLLLDRWRKVEQGKTDDFEIKKLSAEAMDELRAIGNDAVKLESAYFTYRDVTYSPDRQFPQQSYMRAMQAAMRFRDAYQMQLAIERLPVDFTALGITPPFSNNDRLLRADAKLRAVNVLFQRMQDNMRNNESEKPVPTPILEKLFESSLASLDELYADAKKFRDNLFALNMNDGLRKSGIDAERLRMLRNNAEQLYYHIKRSRGFFKAGYLALYDSPNGLRVFPLLCEEALTDDPSGTSDRLEQSLRISPWLSLQTFLLGSDDMIRRFALPDLPKFAATSKTDTQEPGIESVVEPVVEPMSMHLPDQTETFERDGTFLSLLGQIVRNGNPARTVRAAFYEMARAYRTIEDDPGRAQADSSSLTLFERFNRASIALVDTLRSKAESVEPARRELVSRQQTDDAVFEKTSYPSPRLMNIEYRYEVLVPFYWMWVTSAAAVGFLFISLVVSFFVKKSRTCEALFFWCGTLLLLVSGIVTFTGGWFRACITGWAPVTNMFETIVLMAFSSVVFGFWMTFQPLFAGRLACAWRASALPKGRPVSSQQAPSQRTPGERQIALLQNALLFPRVLLAAATFYYVMIAGYADPSTGLLTWDGVRHAVS